MLIEGLAVIWPASRTQLGGVPLGDVWPCNALKVAAKPFTEGDDLVPFHKLTGWTTYSLLEPLQQILKWQFEGLEDLTGLPEYRNGPFSRLKLHHAYAQLTSLAMKLALGGLLVDLGVLSVRADVIPRSFYPDPSSEIPRLPPSHPVIIEWRAMTVIEL